MNARKCQRGFTLVEVMVALFIVALALPALMFQLGTQLDSVQNLQSRTVAGWVAQNQLALLQLNASQGQLAAPGYSRGESELAGVQWQWQMNVETTPVPGLLRHTIDVASALAPTDTLTSLTAYLVAGQTRDNSASGVSASGGFASDGFAGDAP